MRFAAALTAELDRMVGWSCFCAERAPAQAAVRRSAKVLLKAWLTFAAPTSPIGGYRPLVRVRRPLQLPPELRQDATELAHKAALLCAGAWSSLRGVFGIPPSGGPRMLNLLATLVISALPASSAAAATCPDPTPATADVAFGECGESAPLDLWYRMSLFAESDPGGVGAGPARRLQANRSVTVVRRTAGARADLAPDLPPVALVALPTLLPLQGPRYFDGDARDLPARAIAPPERPPRA